MYLQMKLRHYDCVDCGTPCKSTSPNAVRCPKCAKAWEKERNRQNQRRRYQRLMAARAGRLIANRAAAFTVEYSGISRRQRCLLERDPSCTVRIALCCTPGF